MILVSHNKHPILSICPILLSLFYLQLYTNLSLKLLFLCLIFQCLRKCLHALHHGQCDPLLRKTANPFMVISRVILSMLYFNLNTTLVLFKRGLVLWGCIRPNRRLAGHLSTFVKALKDTQHAYPLGTNKKGLECVTKGHQHRCGRTGCTTGGKWKSVGLSLCLCLSVCVCVHDWLSAESY